MRVEVQYGEKLSNLYRIVHSSRLTQGMDAQVWAMQVRLEYDRQRKLWRPYLPTTS